jgi:tetratricopeptide (TPR) repeat protein
MRTGALAFAVGVLTSACAARTQLPAPLDLARADDLTRQGCYTCLIDARAIYDRAGGTQRPATRMRALEVELLLVLREKELSIDSTATMSRARSIAEELPFSSNAAAALALVEAVAPDVAGSQPSERRQPAFGIGSEGVAKALETVEGVPLSPLFRAYLTTSVQCSGAGPAPSSPATPPSEPLLAYRAAFCRNAIDADALGALRDAVPRFVEAALFQGRAAMGRIVGSDGSRARAFLEEAYAKFPRSSAVTLHLGTVHQATGDCRRAHDYFTETLTLRPAHEAARLGRAICRTYLSDFDGGVADATVLIDAVAGNRAEAYYWRAWIRRHLGQLDLARADIERSRALLFNARVLTLAGMIEHDQKDYEQAIADLHQAHEVDPSECLAPWYLALVGYATEHWTEAAKDFASAAECYAGRVESSRTQKAAMAAREDLEPAFRARQMAGFDAAIADDSAQKSAADLNAALNYGRDGDIANATIYMKRAAADPQRRLAVDELRQVLRVPPW